MRPEYPHWFTLEENTELLHLNAGYDHVQACDMLKAGAPCGEEALNLIIGIRADGQGYMGVVLCEWCWDEIGMTGEETTAYWRARQREWGVR